MPYLNQAARQPQRDISMAYLTTKATQEWIAFSLTLDYDLETASYNQVKGLFFTIAIHCYTFE
jgi:hypothetical protein